MGEREPGRRRKIPEWARQERQAELGWIRENAFVFWPAASRAYKDLGRGVIIVDTTQQPNPGGGHPFGYFVQEQIEASDDEDTKRMVQEYNPIKEFVVMLLKPDDRSSTYRVKRQRKRRGR